jgi:MSHA biogenesis protein MshK
MLRTALAGLTGCILPMLAAAQSLSDPTRPPATIAPAQEAVADTAAAAPVLQSVLVSSSRRHAIINGKTVKVGDTVGEAKVVKIAEDEVILHTGKVSQVLKLYPNIEKQSTSERKGAKRGMQQP